MLKGMVGFKQNGTIQDQIIGIITKEIDKQKNEGAKSNGAQQHHITSSSRPEKLGSNSLIDGFLSTKSIMNMMASLIGRRQADSTAHQPTVLSFLNWVTL